MTNENSPNRVNRCFNHAEPTPEEIAERCDKLRGQRQDVAHDADASYRRYRARLRFIQFLSETSER